MACVRKRRVGKSSRWVLDYRDQQGRRHWETTKGNRKEAERLLAERVREISRGTYEAPTESEFRGPGGSLPAPHRTQRSGNNLQGLSRQPAPAPAALPYLQGWKVRDIRRKQVEELRGKLLDSGVGPSTVNKALTLLGALFRYAIQHEYIEANPAEGTKLRASSRRSHDLVEANILAPPEIQALLGDLMPAGA